MKIIAAFVVSVLLLSSCKSSQGCGCLHSDAQQVEAVADSNANA